MKDTLVIIISKNQTYITDYYKKSWRKVQFKDRDYWEIYSYYDINDLVEFLNYPLHYKQFKGINIKIIIDKPIIYEYLYKVQKIFSQAKSIVIIDIESWIIASAYLLNKPIGYIEFEGAFFLTQKVGDIYEISKVEEPNKIKHTSLKDKECNEIIFNQKYSVDNLPFSQIHKDNIKLLLDNSSTLKTTFSKYLVLSPATIRYGKQNTKNHYLKVDDILIIESLKENLSHIKREETLFSYTHEVTKLFRRKEKKVVDKKSEAEGVFHLTLDNDMNSSIWAKKEDVIGYICKERSTSDGNH
ncbi:hypothetical protein AN639_12680 [Candidatus Epulonipiscium fishelsonii]|uniref:Uncharacterized protein n=1 Tax=Candidatus Epulonipiscium fishelsonii TaxID=77094 RepID=A0ACC8XGL0_9FIRM|nr:hypothetical protein AN639_12680 [Epulopiscium sp. SCG-B05WGA-EpuloA1]ONI42701.1 hypothetical protein AN396_13500 [Epulopiscium sp. SCG-B11WGA-EpuloA1]